MMKFYKSKFLQILIGLTISLYANADVFINISATMVTPACDITSVDGNDPIKIDFGIVNLEKLSTEPPQKNFAIFMTGCDLSKALAIVISPKTNGSVMFNGRNILSTSVDGLGISFKDITAAKNTVLNVGKKEQIYPEILNGKGKLDIQAELVNMKPVNKLPKGAFNASMTVLVAYN